MARIGVRLVLAHSRNKVIHMKTATVRQLRTEFPKVNAGQEVAITRRRKIVANLTSMLTTKGSKAVASILGDMEKGGAAEGKQIVGDMLGRARKAGIAAPNLRYAYAHLQTYEARRARSALK